MAQLGKVVRATVRVNNEDDANRVYDISAEVMVGENKEVHSISTGAVLKENTQVATFAQFIDDMSVSYQGVEEGEQVDILLAINDFIASVKRVFSGVESINL